MVGGTVGGMVGGMVSLATRQTPLCMVIPPRAMVLLSIWGVWWVAKLTSPPSPRPSTCSSPDRHPTISPPIIPRSSCDTVTNELAHCRETETVQRRPVASPPPPPPRGWLVSGASSKLPVPALKSRTGPSHNSLVSVSQAVRGMKVGWSGRWSGGWWWGRSGGWLGGWSA